MVWQSGGGGGAGSEVITCNYFRDDFKVSFHVFESFEMKI